jgi:hypothetical protein
MEQTNDEMHFSSQVREWEQTLSERKQDASFVTYKFVYWMLSMPRPHLKEQAPVSNNYHDTKVSSRDIERGEILIDGKVTYQLLSAL